MNKYILKKDLVARWNCNYTLPDYYSRIGVLRRKKVKNKVRYLMEDVIKHEATWLKSQPKRQTVWNKIMTWVKNSKILSRVVTQLNGAGLSTNSPAKSKATLQG